VNQYGYGEKLMGYDVGFEYNAKVLKVVDGDTVDALVDLGFSVHRKIRVRLYGIDAPESRTRDLEEKKKGLAAKARLIEILDEHDYEIIIKSHGVGKYGRCLGELFYIRVELSEDDGEEIREELKTSINNQLIVEGHGVRYYGGKR
jgi:micrococcal nuclease